MVCSCVVPSKRVLLQIIFCSCVIETTFSRERWQIASLIRRAARKWLKKENKLGDRMIKHLLNSVIAKYPDWSVFRRSTICLSTSSLTMNEKFQYRTRPPSAVFKKNFEFIVCERVQVNPNISRAMSVLTFLLFKLNTLQTEIVKLWVSRSHGVMAVVYWIYTTGITPP